MTEAQKDIILGILGELMYDYEATFDWIEKSRIMDKINACNILLDLPKNENDYLGNLIKTVIKLNQESH